MPLTNIEYGSLASSETMNKNFEYLDGRVTTVANNLASESSSIYSSLASMNSQYSQQNEALADDISDLETDLAELTNNFNSMDLTPNYSNAITVVNQAGGSGSHNIDWNGWLAFDLYCFSVNANYQVYIDGVMVGATASDEGDRAAGIAMVKSGSTVSWNGCQSIVIKKIPFVGG